MSFSFGPSAAANTSRLMQALRRRTAAPQARKVALPGEPSLADQIASLGIGLDPAMVAAQQPAPVAPLTLPSGPGPSAGPPRSMAPLAGDPLDTLGQEPAPRNASLAQAEEATSRIMTMGRPAPLVLPTRSYELPGVVTPPTLGPAPQRDLRGESRQALKASLIPAGLGLLLGGAGGALTGLQSTMAGARARSDQEAALAQQQWAQEQQGKMQGYGLQRQEAGDRLARVGQQMRTDSARDEALVRAKGDEWDAYTREMDRLQKAYDAAENREQKSEIALLMDETRRQGQAITALLGEGRLEDSRKRTNIMGNMFGLRKEDIAADNKRADKAQEIDKWYRARQLGVAQGRLNMAQEKAILTGEAKGIKSWVDAQAKIADWNTKAAKLLQGEETLTGRIPPSEEDQLAASMHIEAGRDLASRYGKSWDADSSKWTGVTARPSSTTPQPPDYNPLLKGLGFSNSSGASVKPSIITVDGRRLTPTPVPKGTTMEARGIKPTINPAAQSGNRPTATPKPAPTPKPLDKMTPEEKLAELAKIGAKGLK